MKYVLISSLLLLCGITISAQHTLRLSVKNSEDGMALPGATAVIKSSKTVAIADSLGTATFENLSAGKYNISVSYVGFADHEIAATVPQPTETIVDVLLLPEETHEQEVIVTATRISRSIANLPTRVEVISGEELAEKGNMKPGDIRMLLNETTGIQTQQTSATSYNAGIRIQGLDGRYTQLLRDGYPLYSGFSGGLSILQIAPLDLKQVEVIKGSASTLYGGGAIAGLVNLVSKTPGSKRELSLLTNVTTAGGLDVSGFYSERYGKAGVTMFASRNSNAPYDPANIGLTAIPKFERYTINPRLFLYGTNTTANLGITYITEDRTGGSIEYIKNGGSGFFEKNKTDRITTQLGIAHTMNEGTTLQFKNSFSRFDRIINIPAYTFKALQQSSFSELTWNKRTTGAEWVAGANVVTDELNERQPTGNVARDYSYIVYGMFVQNAWTISKNLTVESGLRGDYVKNFGFELLPRISAMLTISPALTTRIGGGYGYKTPTIFTEEAERIQFRNLLPIDINNSKNERSTGGNWDVNYRTRIGAAAINFNQLFFYTRLDNPLVMVGAPGGKVQFQNSPGYLNTKGIESNLRVVLGNFKLFVGYTYTDATTHFAAGEEWLALTARHRLNNVLMYEIEDKLKLGLEAYYFSKQQLSDGTFGKPYWLHGFMAEKLWEKFSVYINFENFTNTRQTRFDTIYTGSINNPTFRDIYAPVDGFVVNGGVKINL